MQEKLISGMQAAFPGESQASLARRAGLSVQRFNNYVTGIRTMDVDAVIGCAQALGWDIRETEAEKPVLRGRVKVVVVDLADWHAKHFGTRAG